MRLHDGTVSCFESAPLWEGLYVCFFLSDWLFALIRFQSASMYLCDVIQLAGGPCRLLSNLGATVSQLHTTWKSQWPAAEEGQRAPEMNSAKLCERAPARCVGVRDTFHQWGAKKKKHTSAQGKSLRQHVPPCTLSHRAQFTLRRSAGVMQRVLLAHF